MNKSTATFVKLGLILLGIGLIMIIAALVGGADFRDTRSIISGCNFNYVFDDSYISESIDTTNVDFDEITEIDIELEAASIHFEKGETFSVETISPSGRTINVGMRGNHTLALRFRASNTLSDNQAPEIIITLPENLSLEVFSVQLGAGKIDGELDVYCDYGYFDVAAGQIHLTGVHSKKTDINCGVGSLNIQGEFEGKTDIECGMGNVTLVVQNSILPYSWEGEVGMGHISIFENELNGIGERHSIDHETNHFSVECGMGSIKIISDDINRRDW